MMKKLVLLLLVLAGAAGLRAQQEAQFTQYMFNQMAFNPAYAGARDAICVNGLLRQQWVGFKDELGNEVAPQTYLASLDAPIALLHGGMGLTIFQDQLGFEKNIGVKLSYAYRAFLGNGNISVGAQAGFLNKAIDFSKFIPIEENDPVLKAQDEQSTMFTDFAFGVFYQVPEKFWVGLSSNQLAETMSPVGDADYSLARHYFLTAGYDYTLPFNPSFEALPSFLLKSDGNSMSFDLTGMVRYEGRFWGGLSYRLQDGVSAIIGLNVKNFDLGYSYDLTTSKLGSVGSTGSHEIMAKYCFKIEIPKYRTSYKNTLYL
jgi:type IX secretion system PorP/SprF family membrane protein